jgi:hypothetical protein
VGTFNKKERKKVLVVRLKLLQGSGDAEQQHISADYLLLEYINDKVIKKEFLKIKRWYA